MSLEELAFPVVQQHDSSTRNGHAGAREQLRGPLWPASDMWTDAAPKRLRDKSACKTPLKSWARWLEYLESRKRPRAIERLLSAKGSPLAWGVSDSVRQLVQTWDKALQQTSRPRKKQKPTDEQATQVTELQQRITDWQHAARIADGSTEVLWAYQAVAIARALPELAQYLAAEQWWALVNELTIVASEAASLPLIEQSLASQLLAAELPLTLAYQLPELVHCRDLLSAGRQALANGILEFLDGEGVLQQRWWPIQRPLAASWTRCRALQAGIPDKLMDDETLRQYTLAVNELSRATREDGSLVLGTLGEEKVGARETAELFAAAFRFVPDLREKKAAAKFQRSLAMNKSDDEAASTAEVAAAKEEEKPRDYAAPSINSEWAQVAIFRRSWEPREPLLACSYDREQVAIEISTGRETIVSGVWGSSLQVNGQALAMQMPWREVCHTSDADADYLELELQLESGYKIQRQLCLGRKERFVYLCDSVLGQEAANLRYEQTLPLVPGIVAEQDAEMREVTLTGKKPCARVLPLALPEWRSEVRQGDLQAAYSVLTLTTTAHGRNLCAPWWIDLDAKRLGKPLTWRPLTVAENRVICGPDIARGWRVQIAERQWIVYRALTGTGNRTILGHNLISEFLLAQFKNGTTTNLVEIE